MWIWILFGFSVIQPLNCVQGLQQSQSLQFLPRDGKGWGWDSDKSTFFDIALTALAFLSFGVFLLNLLLNALLFPTVGTTGLTQPAGPILTMITAGSTGGAIVTGGTGLGKRNHRRRRQLFSPQIDQVIASRLLVKFVTSSIEAMVDKHECLPKIICEGNRKASVVGNGYQVLLSIFSVSITYLGKLLRLHDETPTLLNAMLIGARNENCQAAFPSCKR